MKRILLFTVFFLLPPAVQSARAQDTGNGLVRLFQWSYAVEYARSDDPGAPDIVIDSLTLGYGYRIIDDRPYMALAVEWQPAISSTVDSISIDFMTLAADVMVEGERAAGLVIDLDSLMLAPYPDLATMELAGATWDGLFDDAGAEQARSYFSKGFTLANLRIESIGFYPPLEESILVAEQVEDRSQRSGRVVRAGGGINVDIPIYRQPRVRPRGDAGEGRAEEPRGEQVGRGRSRDDSGESSGGNQETEGEDESTTRSNTKRKKDESEEDEGDKEVLPAALAGAAAIAMVAVAGGTIGYYGNTKNAPIGLTAGFVRPKWGMLLQVAVNEAVFQRSTVFEERGLARLIGFYDAFGAPVQPTLGIGVLATELGGHIEYDLSVSAGLSLHMGPVLLLGGVDVVSGGVDLGLAYNFRYKR